MNININYDWHLWFRRAGAEDNWRDEVPSGTGPIIRELNYNEAMMEVNNNNRQGRELKRHEGFGKFDNAWVQIKSTYNNNGIKAKC